MILPMRRAGNLHSQLVNELGQSIATGQIVADTVLPSEGDLAAEMGVSRTIAREALKSLAARGMVRARARAGTRVLASTHWTSLDKDVIRWRLAGEDRLEHLKELLELRLLIEPAAAGMAAERSDSDRRQAIWLAFESLASARDDHEGWIEAADRMHSLVLGGCGNELIESLGLLLHSAVLESRQVTRPALDTLPADAAAPYASPIEEALARYRAIATAIRDGDSKAAETETRGLLLRVEELFEYLSTAPGTEGITS